MRADALGPAPKLQRTSAGLEPYVPDATQPWDEVRASHLLRRAVFGPTAAEVDSAIRSTPQAIVSQLLEDQPEPDPPGDWVDDQPFVRPSSAEKKIQREQMDELRRWWMHRLSSTPLSLVERMTLFWHNHFATQASEVKRPQLMFHQNRKFRQNALGNFKSLVLIMNTDPAMLYYLDGRLNKKGKPNENYARELLELFTMGIGHYTEQDVAEAARALTGWVVEGQKAIFDPGRHDNEPKEFLGTLGNLNDLRITNIIFDQPATAEFICRKLYREFVYAHPDENIVRELAHIMRDNNYELKPVVQTLLLSAHFFDASTIGARIKSPVELVAGTARTLGLSVAVGGHVGADFLTDQAELLGQHLLDPPNVNGWTGHRTWISTATLPKRHLHTDRLVEGKSHAVERTWYVMQQPDLNAFIKSFPNPWDATALVRSVGQCLTPFSVDPKRDELLLSVLLEGAEVYDWNPDEPGADLRIANLLKVLFELPDYQLA
ncbi:MAG: hypothetical protein CME26_01360 [Gemmatimonadetes bacterium]|nr:hypothetical protein [Gemmatimonadota bacterium]|tara:strand:- start:703 stop:2172 length:1470 start_codon:yes stop_codon:yes gene_type:complete